LLERSKVAQTQLLTTQRRRQPHQLKLSPQRKTLRELRVAQLQKKSKPRQRSSDLKPKQPSREDWMKSKETSTDQES